MITIDSKNDGSIDINCQICGKHLTYASTPQLKADPIRALQIHCMINHDLLDQEANT
jgi:hypothetical protein